MANSETKFCVKHVRQGFAQNQATYNKKNVMWDLKLLGYRNTVKMGNVFKWDFSSQLRLWSRDREAAKMKRTKLGVVGEQVNIVN